MRTLGNAFKLAIALVAVTMLLAGSAGVVHAQVVMPEREEIVWSSGYWARPGYNNPIWGGWDGEGFDSFFMYDGLFLVDTATGELMPWLGENITWIDDYTIEITLREDINWTDGNPITTEDVIYTFELLAAHWRIGGFEERVENMTAINDRVFRVYIKEDYPHSRIVCNTLTIAGWKIVPKHIWTEIEEEYYQDWFGRGFLVDYSGNWMEIKDEWKVASGPYLPYWQTYDKTIMIRNDEWWGIQYYGLPEPKYIGQLYFETNYAVNTAFEEGMIDWYSGYFPRIWELKEKPIGPYINTWTMMEPPYFLPVSGQVMLVPNHNIYPLSEPWLRRALAYAINYEDISEVSASGYLMQASVTFLCEYVPVQAPLINNTVVEEYGVSYNPEKAIEILEEHCIKVDGAWYTKDAPVVHRGKPIVDELPDEPGRNVKLGPWENIVVYGWSDSMMQNVMLSRDFGDIGIQVEPVNLDYVTYVDRFMTMEFELMNFCMGPSPGATPPIDIYISLFTGTAGEWANYSAYYNPAFEDLLDQLDVTPPDTPEESEVVSKLQEIIARDLPIIPMWYNGYWYAYSTKYWLNWPDEENPRIFPVACWEIGAPQAMKMVITGLRKAPATPVLTVQTEKPSYMFGEELRISGKITDEEGNPVPEQRVEIRVIDPMGTTILTNVTETASDGTYSVSFTLPEEAIRGTYTVSAYSLAVTKETTFDLAPIPPPLYVVYGPWIVTAIVIIIAAAVIIRIRR